MTIFNIHWNKPRGYSTQQGSLVTKACRAQSFMLALGRPQVLGYPTRYQQLCFVFLFPSPCHLLSLSWMFSVLFLWDRTLPVLCLVPSLYKDSWLLWIWHALNTPRNSHANSGLGFGKMYCLLSLKKNDRIVWSQKSVINILRWMSKFFWTGTSFMFSHDAILHPK